MIIISLCFYYFQIGEEKIIDAEIIIEETNSTEDTEETPSEILVDVSGEVVNPGVIKLKNGSRVFEAINKAGGFTENANISFINLVQVLNDEQKIPIPSQDETCCINGLIPIIDISDDGTKTYVCILGEITTPCVVKVNQGCRVIDAIDAAGGLTMNTDLSRVNLAEKLDDEMTLYIPVKGTEVAQNDLININTASLLELTQLNGIGNITAQKIIEYREAHGYFKSIEEIKKVSGIGQGKYEQIKDNICIY